MQQPLKLTLFRSFKRQIQELVDSLKPTDPLTIRFTVSPQTSTIVKVEANQLVFYIARRQLHWALQVCNQEVGWPVNEARIEWCAQKLSPTGSLRLTRKNGVCRLEFDEG